MTIKKKLVYFITHLLYVRYFSQHYFRFNEVHLESRVFDYIHDIRLVMKEIFDF